MEIDANEMIAEVTSQRNAALDEAAMLRVAVKQLQSELDELRSKDE